MEMRKLGGSGLETAPLVLGGNVFGWTADEQASFAILDAFTDAGFNAVDTANVYSRWIPGHKGGESETVIGQWFALGGSRREKTLLITKVGLDMGEGGKGLSAANIVRACEDSLKRLQTDYIDLYLSHRADPDAPIDETLEAYQQLIDAGKVRAVGGSNYTADELGEALAASGEGKPKYEVLQPYYNLLVRDQFEGALADLCVKEGLGVIPYFALAAGFLTGKYRTEADLKKSQRGGNFKDMLSGRPQDLLKVMDVVAERHGVTLAQVALAWLMAKPGVTAPIASATSLEQLGDIMKAADIELTPHDMAELDAA